MSIDTNFGLAFSPVLNNRGEVCLLDRYFTGLQRVLRRMRVLTLSMRLFSEDLSLQDFTKPIRLQRVSVGGLTLSDGFYYLNKINAYQDGQVCSVTLVGF